MDRRGKGGQENQWKARNDVDSNLDLSQNLFIYLTPSSVQFNCLVMSDSLWPCGLQYTSLPCPSPTPGAYSNSCPLSQWCHPTNLILCHLFSSCLQSFPASGSFQMNQFFTSGGQSIGVSASASVLPMNIQDWFPLGLTGGSPCSPRDSQESSPTPQFKASIHRCSAFFIVQLSHWYLTTGKTIALTRWIFVGKVMSLLFNMLSRLVIAFLPRSVFSFHGCSHHLQWYWRPKK